MTQRSLSRVITPLLLAAAIASLTFVGTADAQTLTWSGTGSFLGPGTWNSANSNWWNGTANQTWTSGSTAAFGVSTGTGSTVTVSGSVSAGGIVFNPLSVTGATAGSSFTLTGGTIGIGSGNSILTSGTASNTNGIHTINSTLVGSNLSIGRAPGAGNGASPVMGVILTGTNQFLTGTLTVGGTVNTQSVRVLATGSAVSGLSSVVAGASSIFGANADNSVFNFNIQLGAGAQLLNTFGSMTASGTISLAGDNAQLVGNSGKTMTLQGPIVDISGGIAKTLTVFNRGTTVLTGASTFSGTWALGQPNSGGVVILDGGDNRLPAAASLSFTTSTNTLVLGTSAAVNQTIASLTSDMSRSSNALMAGASGTSTLTVNLASGTNTFYGRLGGAGYMVNGSNISNGNGNNLALVKLGAGTLVLGNANTYTGTTAVTGGTLLFDPSIYASGTGTTISNLLASSGTVTIGDGATLALKGRANQASATLTSGSYNQTSQSVTVASTAGLVPGAVISGSGIAAGTYVQAVLSATQFLANQSISSGTFSGQSITVGATNFTTAQSIAGLTLPSGTGTVSVSNAGQGAALTVTGPVAGNGALSKAGDGTLVFNGVNTYSGATRVSGGILTAGNANALQNSTLDMNPLDSGTVTFSQDSTLGGLSGTRNLDAGGFSLRIGNNAQSTTYSGTFSNGSLVKLGSGTFTLSSVNTYTGSTAIVAGQLSIGSGGRINGSSGVTINGGELKYNSATTLSAPIVFTAGTLSGTGSIGTAVSVGSGAILSPGNSPGSQAFTSGLTFAPGGQYTWEINDWAGSPGTGYDQLVVSGSALNITATSGSTFKIAITGLTAGNVAGAVPGFNGSAGTSFTIATSSAGITGFDRSDFTVDRSGFTNTLPTNAGFWVSQSGNNLLLNYAPSATYNLSANATAAAIRVGGTSWITATVTSSTAAVTNPDSVAYSGLALSGSLGSLSATSGTLAGGLSGSGSAAFIPVSSGSYAFSPSLSTATNVNIGTSAIAGSTSGVNVSVWNPAAANSISGTLSLGTVLKGGVLSQALSIQNTAPNDGFSEKLDAGFGTLSGVTTNSGSISLLGPQATDASTMVVGFSTATAGGKTGSAQLNFWTNGQGTSGLTPLQLASQTVSLSGTVLDPAVASFASGSAATASLLLDFGDVNQNASISPLGFSLYNLTQTSGYTADLALLNVLSGTGNTSAIATTLPSQFFNLASGSSFAYSASLSTASLGAFQNVYTLQFKSANNGSAFNADATQNLTLIVKGVVVVPEPGALALAGCGVTLAGWSLWKRRRTTA